jgi:hypothetical protein
MSQSVVDEMDVEDFAICTDHPDYFRTKIEPLLSSLDEKPIFEALHRDAEKRQIGTSDDIYRARDENMGSWISEDEMVREAIGFDQSKAESYFVYVRVLYFVYKNPGCRMIEIVKGTNLGFSSVQWGIWKHAENTKLVEKDTSKKRGFKISGKFAMIEKKLRDLTLDSSRPA